MPTKLDRETCDRLIAALIAIEMNTFVDKSDAIKIVLGEIGNIWPDDVQGDVCENINNEPNEDESEAA